MRRINVRASLAPLKDRAIPKHHGVWTAGARVGIFWRLQRGGGLVRGRRLGFTASVLLAATTSGAWSPLWPAANLADPKFNEQVRPEAPVAGGDIIGIVVGPGNWQARGQRLFVRSPGKFVSSVCIEAASVDGGYVAFNDYHFAPQDAGTYVEIPLEAAQPKGTVYPQRFAAASAQTMALLAREGTCDTRATRLLPLKWATREAPDTGEVTLTIAVQSGRSTAFLAIGDSSYTPCTPIPAERLTAFDTLCEATIPAVRSQSVPLRLRRCAFDDCVNAPADMLDL